MAPEGCHKSPPSKVLPCLQVLQVAQTMIPRNFNLPPGCRIEDIDPPEEDDDEGGETADDEADRQRKIANDDL